MLLLSKQVYYFFYISLKNIIENFIEMQNRSTPNMPSPRKFSANLKPLDGYFKSPSPMTPPTWLYDWEKWPVGRSVGWSAKRESTYQEKHQSHDSKTASPSTKAKVNLPYSCSTTCSMLISILYTFRTCSPGNIVSLGAPLGNKFSNILLLRNWRVVCLCSSENIFQI